MSKIELDAKVLLKPLKISEIINFCEYNEIEIYLKPIEEIFAKRNFRFIYLSNFIKNTEMFGIISMLKNKKIKVLWKIDIETDSEILKNIIFLAKKYMIYGISLSCNSNKNKINIKEITKALGEKTANFVRNFHDDITKNGLFLRVVEKMS
ncbi:MAG: hypothetical protein N2446_01850 [Elusimicrobiales bacterium]|nr:hypothetical protein [Elusimicrobiales bacterium]